MGNINHVMWKVLSDKAGKEEVDQLDQWLGQSDENRQIFEVIKNNWIKRTEEPTFINEEEVFDKIWKKGTGNSGRLVSFDFKSIAKVAASLLILFTAGYFIHTYKNQPENITVQAEMQLITKENPAGQKSKLFLPDGTNVWLNAESSVQYLENFTDSSRVVQLTGEAFFEVAKDSIRPFVVQAENIFIHALGTSFNVDAFTDNERVDINLISGKVEINSDQLNENIILNPGEALNFNIKTHVARKFRFKTLEAVAWKDGVLVFEDASFDDVIPILKRWYGIEIQVIGKPGTDWHFRGRFNNESLVNVLQVMQYNRDFNYELKGKYLKMIFN
jgi:transmembrane sensor